MKVLLSEIESCAAAHALEEAQELVMETKEYAINQVEEGYYHCISSQPEFHVEISIRKDGLAVPVCQCSIFKRSRQCRHAIAALLLLRDYIQRNNRSRKKTNLEQHVLDEVLRKMTVSQLRSFLSSYAISHSVFRAELLANYLNLTRNPNYHNLYMDVAPIDKYGQVRLNRNSIKTLRGISAILLRQAQQLLKERALAETLRILEAVILHLHRLLGKTPQFQDQLMVEIRIAYKVFEGLCAQHMAPRLQIRAINLALDICGREGYIFPSGMKPLLAIIEPFLLEEKTRKSAFSLVEMKIQSGQIQNIQWACLLFRWSRLWSMDFSTAGLRKKLEKLLPSAIIENNQQSRHDDVLYLIDRLKPEEYTDPVNKTSLLAGLKSARTIMNKDLTTSLAYKLALNHLDTNAWEVLLELDPVSARRILSVVEELYGPASHAEADQLLLNGWKMTGQGLSIIQRLKTMGQLERLLEYDFMLKDKCRDDLVAAYAEHILSVREAYGGMMARQKLNNIFNHIKGLDLHQSVSMKMKEMEKTKTEESIQEKSMIKGFVFDLDGVIVDTAIHHFRSWKKIMKELGVDIEDSDDDHTRGAGRMESLEYLLNRYNVNLTEEEKQYWADRKNDIYVQAIHSITPADLLPGALTFLEASRQLGLLLALGSASKNARAVLQKLGVENYFDAILDGNDAKSSKPDPEIFLNASAALDLAPSEVVVFEDAAKGVQAALSAGCYAVGIGDPATLSAAHIVIPGLADSSPSNIIDRLV